MLGHQRKARILFELSDIVLATLAFEIAYRTRGGSQGEAKGGKEGEGTHGATH